MSRKSFRTHLVALSLTIALVGLPMSATAASISTENEPLAVTGAGATSGEAPAAEPILRGARVEYQEAGADQKRRSSHSCQHDGEADGAESVILCLTHEPASSLSDAITKARGKSSPSPQTSSQDRLSAQQSASLPLPPDCIANGSDIDRYYHCRISSLTAVWYDSNWKTIGTLGATIASWTYMNRLNNRVVHQLDHLTVQRSGIATTAVITDIQATCTGKCNKLEQSFDSTATTPGEWTGGEAGFEGALSATTLRANIDSKWTWRYTASGTTSINQAGTYVHQSRCDNELPGSGPGCVVPQVSPVLVYGSGNYPDFTRHISLAQASGLPGPRGGPALQRTTNESFINSSRRTACPSTLPSIEGLSCDEYPFASTLQGAVQGGAARTFDGCFLDDPRLFGPTGYSRCMIDHTENSLAGSDLGAFYSLERIINVDSFFVEVS